MALRKVQLSLNTSSLALRKVLSRQVAQSPRVIYVKYSVSKSFTLKLSLNSLADSLFLALQSQVLSFT